MAADHVLSYVRPIVGDELFERTYVAEFDGMVRLARVVLDDPVHAEDVVQEAFAQLYRRMGSVRGPGGYLKVAVINGARSTNRRRRTAVRLGLTTIGTAPAMDAGHDDLLDAVRRLPRRRLEVVVLRFYEDLSVAEVAEVLGMPEGTVKSLSHRALLQLKEWVQDA